MKTPLIPLAERLRPKKLDEIVGQPHLTGHDGIFNKLLQGGLPSMILWGPPGVGKITLAYILAGNAGLPMFTLSAISADTGDAAASTSKLTSTGMERNLLDEFCSATRRRV